ncbi:hypothetical protein BOTBODRAFT_179274 [Botryobasidium botryosum FD-172 SS1]|uniref:BTB domain-containing protein n=1 Tax=Botryobasidium botryosum (strain FD-172 SS1) TaxID=930990 RepID=A0A067MBX3_BOTB1|nr:hypothetical protein BOTBODRAFT_179274 [Botryobasidium botryosum FD-172 SS1]
MSGNIPTITKAALDAIFEVVQSAITQARAEESENVKRLLDEERARHDAQIRELSETNSQLLERLERLESIMGKLEAEKATLQTVLDGRTENQVPAATNDIPSAIISVLPPAHPLARKRSRELSSVPTEAVSENEMPAPTDLPPTTDSDESPATKRQKNSTEPTALAADALVFTAPRISPSPPAIPMQSNTDSVLPQEAGALQLGQLQMPVGTDMPTAANRTADTGALVATPDIATRADDPSSPTVLSTLNVYFDLERTRGAMASSSDISTEDYYSQALYHITFDEFCIQTTMLAQEEELPPLNAGSSNKKVAPRKSKSVVKDDNETQVTPIVQSVQSRKRAAESPAWVEASNTAKRPKSNRDERFWLRGGDVVVRVEGILFRVYSAFLEVRSPYFASLFSKKDNGREIIDECRVFELAGRKCHFTALLDALLGDLLLLTDRVPSFFTLACVLRASHQWNVPSCKAWAVAQLRHDWPLDVEQLCDDQVLNNHASILVILSRECEVPSLLKPALYRLLRQTNFDLHLITKVDADADNDLKYKHEKIDWLIADFRLSHEDITRAIALKDYASREWRWLSYRPPSKGDRSCAEALKDTWHRTVTESSTVSGRLYDPLRNLQNLINIDWTKKGVCSSCSSRYRDHWKADILRIWEEIDTKVLKELESIGDITQP